MIGPTTVSYTHLDAYKRQAQGNSTIINLTTSGYMRGSPRFALDGNAILFKTERYGMRAHASWGSQDDAMLVFLNQDAYDK